MFLRLSCLSLQAVLLSALIGFVEPGDCQDRSSPANPGTKTDALVPAWLPTGNMHTARSFHTATLLASGKVLVAGGLGPGGLFSAELYDPSAGVWTDTGAMNVQRRGHTATLLTNGQVLVVGGDGSPDFQSLGLSGSAELYDPASGTWRTTGRLNTPRAAFSATLLDDGKVLVAGGVDNDDNALASAELYDPVAGTWRYTGNLAVARFAHSATRVADGRVLVVAGSNDDFFQTTISSAEIYDPALGIWTAAGTIGTALGTARQDVTTALLQSGKVLVAGGYANNGGTPTSYALAELFDPVTRWSPTGAMNVAREGHTMTLLSGGEVLVTGGFDWMSDSRLSTTELYEPLSGTWRIASSMSTARVGHTATLLPSGQVLVAGGAVVGPTNTPLASAELYEATPPPAGAPALDVSIGPPGAMTIDGKGNVYFSARNIVFKLDGAGTLTRVAGNGRPGYSGDGGPAADALLDIPYDQYPELLHDPTQYGPLVGGLAVDTSGNLYIADAYNNRVRKVDTSGIITTVAGGNGINATGAPALGASLPWPQGVAFDSAGRLHIADGGALDRVSPDGLLTLLASCVAVRPSLCSSGQIAIDGSGNIYVPDACQVRKVSPDGSSIVTVAGDPQPFTCGYSGDGGPAINAKLSGPYGVALDALGSLYIADTYNNCIRKVDGAGIITTVAGVCVPAVAGYFYFGDGGPATSARLSLPSGVAVDSALNLYIADAGNNRIRKVTPDGIITTIAGDGGEAAVAVEYYYAAWDFYFVTAYPTEAAALDAGAFGGAWKPTGQVFDAWTGPTSQAVPTCRFFNATFAPKSSHFYTPYAAECASLKAGTAWQYEGIAFYVRLPDANGLCAAGSIPLYRAYNNGMGGAPNHRYTTSLTILNQMLAAGWLFEGNGDTKAFACVPQVP